MREPATPTTLRFRPDLARVLARHAALWRGEKLAPPLIFVDERDTGVRTAGQLSEWWRDPEGFAAHFAPRFARRARVNDDRLPILRPPFSHAILPGLLGARVADAAGTLWAEGAAATSPEELLARRPDFAGELAGRFAGYYRRLLECARGNFLVSTYEAQGPCDLAAALLGAERWMLLAGSAPERARALAEHLGRAAADFYRWTARLVGEGQGHLGGTILSQIWAPPRTVYFCDHLAHNLGPELFEAVVLPGERALLAGFERAYLSIYPQTAAAIMPALLAHPQLRVVYGCEENPSDELLQEYAGRRIFFLRCRDRAEIERYRKLTGDRGLILWTFIEDPDAANRLIESL